MKKEELAALLNGREYLKEMTSKEKRLARESRLLVAFGASDDLIELRGAIYEESYGSIVIGLDGKLLPSDIEDEEVEALEKHGVLHTVKAIRDKAIRVNGIFGVGDYSWTFETTAPHATFEIMDGEEKFCRGIVIDLKEVEALNA